MSKVLSKIKGLLKRESKWENEVILSPEQHREIESQPKTKAYKYLKRGNRANDGYKDARAGLYNKRNGYALATGIAAFAIGTIVYPLGHEGVSNKQFEQATKDIINQKAVVDTIDESKPLNAKAMSYGELTNDEISYDARTIFQDSGSYEDDYKFAVENNIKEINVTVNGHKYNFTTEQMGEILKVAEREDNYYQGSAVEKASIAGVLACGVIEAIIFKSMSLNSCYRRKNKNYTKALEAFQNSQQKVIV